MTDCHTIEDRFSDLLDDAVTPDERRAIDAHLAGCDACRAAWEEYRDAVAALRDLPEARTTPELQAATLAAVDRAAAAPAAHHEAAHEASGTRTNAAGRLLPVAIGTLGGAAAAALVAWLLWPGVPAAPEPAPAPVVRLEGLPGDVRLAAGQRWQGSGVSIAHLEDGAVHVRVDEPAPVAAAPQEATPATWPRVVGLPIPMPVPVYVPVERVRERVVARGPLLEFDAAPLGRAVESFGRDLGAGLEKLATARRVTSAAAPVARAESPRAEPTPREPERSRESGARVHVERRHGRVSLRTAGTVDELVPALLAQLETAEPDVALVVERRLASIHAEAAAEPSARDRLTPPPAQLESPGLHSVRAVADGWAAWWEANRAVIVATARPRAGL